MPANAPVMTTTFPFTRAPCSKSLSSGTWLMSAEVKDDEEVKNRLALRLRNKYQGLVTLWKAKGRPVLRVCIHF